MYYLSSSCPLALILNPAFLPDSKCQATCYKIQIFSLFPLKGVLFLKPHSSCTWLCLLSYSCLCLPSLVALLKVVKMIFTGGLKSQWGNKDHRGTLKARLSGRWKCDFERCDGNFEVFPPSPPTDNVHLLSLSRYLHFLRILLCVFF
jgi:hypothetical protein